MSLDFTIDTREWEKLGDKLERLDDAAIREIRRAVRRSVATMETNIVGFTPVGATANLRQSWATEVRSIPAGVRGEVFSPLVYAPVVELGRQPGRTPPPIAPIHTWVIRKGIASGPEARAAAFAISKSIGAKGTKGAFMLKKGLRRSLPAIQQIFDDVPRRLVAELAKK